jgi:hypothetical protein
MDKYYIVGLDGRQTPDPQYWYDRWVCIKAASMDDAKEVYRQDVRQWLAEYEVPYVQVWAILNEEVNVGVWISQNMNAYARPIPEERPLNRLTAAEYLDDYRMYLQNCDQPDQRNPQTYMKELEYQEGPISPYTKNRFFKLVHEYYMEDAVQLLDNLRQDISDTVSAWFYKGADSLEVKKQVARWSEDVTTKLEITIRNFMEAMEK